jgi:hypothetical protein
VCYRTLKRALEAMVRNGSIMPYKKTYRVSDPSAHRSYGTIVLLLRGSADPLYHSPGFVEYLRAFQYECSRMQTRLSILTFDYAGDKMVCTNRRNGLRFGEDELGSILGFLMWTRGLSDRELPGMLVRLSAMGKPVSVLDESGLLSPPSVGSARTRILILSPSTSAAAGVNVGRYLLDLGHQRIAFFSVSNQPAWSQNRLRGLQDAYTWAGLPSGVVPLTADRSPRAAGLRGLDRSIDRGFDAFLSSLDSTRGGEVLARAVRRTRTEPLRNLLRTISLDIAARGALEPLFEQALSDRTITAWVGENDGVAFGALDFLKQHGLSVPHDRSVLGFDDTLGAFTRDVTSYDFNIPAVMHAMVSHVVRPEARGSRNRWATVGGYVNRRGSTGRAPSTAA